MPFYAIQDATTGEEIEIEIEVDPHGFTVEGPQGQPQIVFDFDQGELRLYLADPETGDAGRPLCSVPVHAPPAKPARLVLPRRQ